MSLQQLRQAIDARATTSFQHEDGRYSVEPYCVGYNLPLTRTAGPLILRGWCLANHQWRDFQVKHMSSIKVTSEHFSPDRPEYSPLQWVIGDVFGRADGRSAP